MATPWSSSTAYSPGNIVLYNGLEYVRSRFPEAPTAGTPPTEEMSVDDYDTDIRTWTLNQITYGDGGGFFKGYFRLIAPTYNAENLEPDFEYYGYSSFNISAYDEVPLDYDLGTTVEWDQEIEDSPECPADKCGVFIQQKIAGYVYCSATVTSNLTPSTPKVYLGWVQFNHPLYFRRTITVLVRVSQSVSQATGPPVVTFINTPYEVTPTDNCYTQTGITKTLTNSAFGFTVPANVPGGPGGVGAISYNLSEVHIMDVDSND